jgi:SagB-type dehydrogenase family enzyme
LDDTLSQRRSLRIFADRPLNEDQILRLCWAAQGITDPSGHRTAPSAGARYPLELYVATAAGCFAYDPPHHRLVRRTEDDLRQAMQWAALSRSRSVRARRSSWSPPCRTAPPRNTGTGERYVHLEGGHAAQNLLLEATAIGLGAVPIGAFDDARLRKSSTCRLTTKSCT